MDIDEHWNGKLSEARNGAAEQIASLLQTFAQQLRTEVEAQCEGDCDHTLSAYVQQTLYEAQVAFHDFAGNSRQELLEWLRGLLAENLRTYWRDCRQLADVETPIDSLFGSEANLGEGEENLPNTRVDLPISKESGLDSPWSPGPGGLPEPGGRYEYLRLLGRGGFGVVYLARDIRLQRDVAIKMPRPDALLTRPLIRRFLKEARNVANLDHPNIVPLLGTEETSSLPCIIYHYCPGMTLSKWMHESHRRSPERLVARIGVLLAAGIQHAHSRGILHRDLKPSNILLESATNQDSTHGFWDGDTLRVPRITDFGISKAFAKELNETRSDSVIGTLEYMAPEQVKQRSQDVGTHSDVYVLGAILFEVLTGIRLHNEEDAGKRLERLKEHPLPPRRTLAVPISADFYSILQRCLEPEIKQRYATAEELSQDLQAFLGNRPVQARPHPLHFRLMKWAQRQPAIAALSCLSLVFILFCGVLVWREWKSNRAFQAKLVTKNEELRAERDRANAIANDLRLQRYREDVRKSIDAFTKGDVVTYHQTLLAHQDSTFHRDRMDSAWNYAWSLGHFAHRSTPVSSKPVYSLQFSPDEARLITSGADGWIRILDRSELRLIREWDAEQSEVNCATYSPNGEWIASAGDDGSIRVWDAESGQLWSHFTAHHDHALQVVFIDDETLATSGLDPVIRLWNWRMGIQHPELSDHYKSVHSLAYDARHRLLYSGSDEGLRFARCLAQSPWRAPSIGEPDIANFEHNYVTHFFNDRRMCIPLHSARYAGYPIINSTRVCKVCLIPSEERSQSDHGNWREQGGMFGDVSGRIAYESFALNGDESNLVAQLPVGSIESLVASHRHFAVGTRDGVIRLGNIAHDGTPERLDLHQGLKWAAHQGRIYDLRFSADGRVLYSVGTDGHLREWSIEERDKDWHSLVIDEVLGSGATVVAAPMGDRFLAIGAGLNLYRWDTGNNLRHLWLTTEGQIKQVCTDKRSSMIYTGATGTAIQAWYSEGDVLHQLWEYPLEGMTLAYYGMDYCPLRSELAFSGRNRQGINQVVILSALTGMAKQTVQFPEVFGEAASSICYSSDGRRLAGAFGRTLFLWDAETNAMTTHEVCSNTIHSFAFAPNGTDLVIGAEDQRLRIWDTQAGRCKQEIVHHSGLICSVAFSEDGHYLMTTDDHSNLALWDTNDWQHLLTIETRKPVALIGQWSLSRLTTRIDPNEIRVAPLSKHFSR